MQNYISKSITRSITTRNNDINVSPRSPLDAIIIMVKCIKITADIVNVLCFVNKMIVHHVK